MKEPSDNTIPTIDVATKRKRRKGGTSFSTSKQRKRRELRKKDLTSIEGRGIPSYLNDKPFGIEETGYSNPQLNLHPIEEEREDNGSRLPSMAGSEHRTNSNQSSSREETIEDSISNVRLCWVLSPLDEEQEFRFWV
jgi:hypothetical protein